MNNNQEFIQENQGEWINVGQSLLKKRESLGFTASDISKLLGTSASRIRKFELGQPVMMAKHLERTYRLALDSVLLKAQLVVNGN
ncbi:hypothetical protein ACQCT3_18110 [Sutcliffiella horikoshii]|uniref:hypothetical protein n=1 Tax=Sutcliffiella horikoshii TaxID=79883 RepID=UPI003CEB34A8